MSEQEILIRSRVQSPMSHVTRQQLPGGTQQPSPDLSVPGWKVRSSVTSSVLTAWHVVRLLMPQNSFSVSSALPELTSVPSSTELELVMGKELM